LREQDPQRLAADMEPDEFPPDRANRSIVTTWTPALRRLSVGGQGPEDVAVLRDRLVTGVADGRLLSVALDGTDVRVVADTGGRPLGIEILPDGRLVVCDAQRGLLRVDPVTGSIEPLTTTIDGDPMKFCNNAAVAADETIYFTESSRRHRFDGYQAEVIERTATGRLLRRDPSGDVEVLLDHLDFANGVALAEDESFVAVSETGAARIQRLWLTGPRAGQCEPLVENLPGIPDNLSTGADGRMWVALPTPRLLVVRLAQQCPRWARRRLGWLAAAIDVRVPAAARVLAVDRDGQTVARIECGRRYRMVTGVREHAGSLYFGSLTERAIATSTFALH
jgi:sugar lactone lactonase YvrE